MTLGVTIRQFRLRQTIKQLDLAIRLGVSVSTVSRIENDKVKIKVEMLPSLAEMLNTTVESLLQKDTSIESPTTNISKNERILYERCIHQWEKENQLLKHELVEKKLEIQQLRIENKKLQK